MTWKDKLNFFFAKATGYEGAQNHTTQNSPENQSHITGTVVSRHWNPSFHDTTMYSYKVRGSDGTDYLFHQTDYERISIKEGDSISIRKEDAEKSRFLMYGKNIREIDFNLNGNEITAERQVLMWEKPAPTASQVMDEFAQRAHENLETFTQESNRGMLNFRENAERRMREFEENSEREMKRFERKNFWSRFL